MAIKAKLCAFILIILSAQAVLIPVIFVMDVSHELTSISKESNDSPFIPDDPSTSDEDSSGSICLDLEEEMLQPHSFLIVHLTPDDQSLTGMSSFHPPLQGAVRNLLKPPQFV
jgi:hypothetical protein